MSIQIATIGAEAIAAQVETAIAASSPFADIAEPFPGMRFVTTAQQTIVAQTVYLMRVMVMEPMPVTKMSVYTTATGTNVDFAILDAAYATLVGIAAPVASVANSLTTGNLEVEFTYEPGTVYYHAVLPDATTTGFRGISSTQSSIINVGGTLTSLSKAVAQNTIPDPVDLPTVDPKAIWIAGHN